MIILKFKARNMVIEYLLCCVWFFFFFGHTACSLTGVESTPPAVEACSLNHRTTREVLEQLLCEQALCQKLSCF